MLIVKNLSFGLDGRVLVYPFSITIDDGSITGVVGRSGSGKSVLLKLLAGEAGRHDGGIHVDGRELSSISKKERTRLLSYQSGVRPDNGEETVGDFLLSARIPYKKFLRPYSGIDLQFVQDYIRLFELSVVRDRPLKKLTGSAMAKTILAHAFIGDPGILLLDNVSSELDPRDRRLLAGALSRFTLDGKRSVILASNDLNLIFQTVDSVLFIRDGKIDASVEPEQIDAELIKRCFDMDALISRNIYNGRPEVHFFSG